MFKMNVLILLLAALGLMGCTASTQYTWKNYDSKLYRHYKNPADQERFIADLEETIVSSEARNNVPPGLYAEYGYALYERGDYAEATVNFQKEHDRWPESRVLMSKMINNAAAMAKRKSIETNSPETSGETK